jgi:hypothetical protein
MTHKEMIIKVQMCDFDGAVWCHLVQDVVQRWAFVNMEMSI